MELFRLEQVGFSYPTGEPALRQIDLNINAGEFIVLCGGSGCGKTTLLRQMKPELTPHGVKTGRILYRGRTFAETDERELAAGIGYVGQNPEDQIVTDRVWHELAFGLESLGLPTPVIRRRTAEMSQFFGIQEWFHQDTASLSGGQKQLLNLAAVMVMQPDILLLDEPSGQLDPVAAGEFMAALNRIHRELGTTIVLAEHRLEEAFAYCTRLLILAEGRLCYDGSPELAGGWYRKRGETPELLPAPIRLWSMLEEHDERSPLGIADSRAWFSRYWREQGKADAPNDGARAADSRDGQEAETARSGLRLEMRDVWFRYEKQGKDILQGISLTLSGGELLAILGGNGSGKSTLLMLISGAYKRQRGSLRISSSEKPRIGLLPQNPQLLLLAESVERELKSCGRTPEAVRNMIRLCRLEELLERHPYDLSGGEQQRLALAKVLLQEPDILLLDEPTKGLDGGYKRILAEILQERKQRGTAILLVSHDVEFCAEYADSCALMFDGQITAQAAPPQFFSENYFYTTSINRMVRHILPETVTVRAALRACGRETARSGAGGGTGGTEADGAGDGTDEAKPEGAGREPDEAKSDDAGRGSGSAESEDAERRLYRECGSRNANGAGILPGLMVVLLAVPATIYLGAHFLKDEKYLFISLLILLECMLPFFLHFEKRRPPVRDLVMLAVLCALGVAGRAVFAMLPSFKPMTALAIIAGTAYGGECGFLVGALTMLVSNMVFGQGAWTPWQMFAMGLIGFLAGLLFHNQKGTYSVPLLCLYGGAASVLIYGGIMNPVAAVLSGQALGWSVLTAYWLSGFPLDLVHGIATVLFLLAGSHPILRKLERVKQKYG